VPCAKKYALSECLASVVPKPKFNKTEYQRLYMADLRAAKKIGITIREYRERKRDA